MPRLGQALVLIAILVLVALPPRLLDTDRFVTTDELFWMGRTGGFARALGTGQLAGTFQSGHPGVTTMWTALLGAGPDLVGQLAGSRREVSRREVSEHPAFMSALAAARRGFGLATTLGIVLAVLLAWRLFGFGPALVGGLLLSLDPFFLAHSRLAHIDASLAIWMTVAVLAGLARGSGGGLAFLGLSGAATALALLSKSPALSLAAFVPLALTVPRIGHLGLGRPARGRPADRLGADARVGAAVTDVVVWALVAAAVYVAVWPAMWVAPLDTLSRVFGFIGDNANAEHAAAADSDGAGVLFYPLVLLLRSTPLTLLGLAALLALRPRGSVGRAALVLGLVAIGFGAAMTVAAKGFDRYLLPIFPALDLLAGLGLWLGLMRLRLAVHLVAAGRRGTEGRAAATRVDLAAGAVATTVVVGLSAWWVAGAWPHGLTYANPLFGGLPAAHRSVASGWGEGLDQVAAYLNAKPNAERLKVGMPGEIYTTVLGAQLAGQVGPIDAATADPSAWDYVVVYTRNLQAGDRPAFLDGTLLTWVPEHTVVLNGVEYAWIYDATNGIPVGATYGGLVTLEGYGVDAATVTMARRLPDEGGRLDVRLHWRALAELPPDTAVQLELLDRDGRLVASARRPLWPTDRNPPSAGARTTQRVPLGLETRTSPGLYVLTVSVLDPVGVPLAIGDTPPGNEGTRADPHRVRPRTITVR